jgi:hypothetical protein
MNIDVQGVTQILCRANSESQDYSLDLQQLDSVIGFLPQNVSRITSAVSSKTSSWFYKISSLVEVIVTSVAVATAWCP